MPSGIPVATVAINGAKNAGILAAQMIGISNQEISNAVKKFKTDLAQKVEKDNASL
jgi:5-(carboxyamino)imidazole ribonucleotide mutase